MPMSHNRGNPTSHIRSFRSTLPGPPGPLAVSEVTVNRVSRPEVATPWVASDDDAFLTTTSFFASIEWRHRSMTSWRWACSAVPIATTYGRFRHRRLRHRIPTCQVHRRCLASVSADGRRLCTAEFWQLNIGRQTSAIWYPTSQVWCRVPTTEEIIVACLYLRYDDYNYLSYTQV